MIWMVDLAGYAAPIMVLLMARDMIVRVLGMLSHVTGAVLGIAECLLPGLSPHLMLLPMSLLRLWDMLTGPTGARSSQNTVSPQERLAGWLRRKGG